MMEGNQYGMPQGMVGQGQRMQGMPVGGPYPGHAAGYEGAPMGGMNQQGQGQGQGMQGQGMQGQGQGMGPPIGQGMGPQGMMGLGPVPPGGMMAQQGMPHAMMVQQQQQQQQHPHQQHQQHQQQGPGQGGRSDALEELLGPFPCARLRGLPFEANAEDVLRFFQGVSCLDVVMVTRPDGRGAGEALVVFNTPMDFNMALSRNKHHMGRRYIEIFQAKRMDYYQGVASLMAMGQGQQHQGQGSQGGYRGGQGDQIGPQGPPQQGEHTGVLRMRGLPFHASTNEVLQFFQGLNVVPDSVQFVTRGDGRVTGEAFITLASLQDAEAAMALNGKHMGSRYLELFPSSAEEAVRIMSRYS